MQRTGVCIFFLMILLARFSWAIDPGTASGTLSVGGDSVKLTHSYAHLHDNAEKWLDTPQELRILLADREMPETCLAGLNPFMTLSELVRQNRIRGLLLRLDPAKPNSILATVLHPPKDPRQSLTNETISNSSKSPIDGFRLSSTRVMGAMAHRKDGHADFGWPPVDIKADFSAPLFNEPAVTATLTGRQALESVQGKALMAKAQALAKGDLKAAQQYSTRRSNQQTEAFTAQLGADAPNMAKQMGAEMMKELKAGKARLVVRGRSAALILGEKEATMYSIVQEDGAWKVD